MLIWSSSFLNPEPASDIIQLEESGTMSLDDDWPVEQASFIYQHQLFTLCFNVSRAAMIMYYQMSFPSEINFNNSSMHPALKEIENKSV